MNVHFTVYFVQMSSFTSCVQYVINSTVVVPVRICTNYFTKNNSIMILRKKIKHAFG